MRLEALKAAGFNVDIQSMDWGTLITRRASRKPVNEGGWNIFHTWTTAPDLLSPALNAGLCSNRDKAWFGWPRDDRLEAPIDQWFKAPDAAAQKRLIDQIQTEAYKNDIPYIPTGQFVLPNAYRKNLTGIVVVPVVFLWNVDKQ
jgi:peptide/nickel transport system substrate-binding protein